MIYLKTIEDIELLRSANHLLGRTLAEVARHVKSGVSTLQLDRIANEYICDNGASPAFLGYGENAFPNTLCTSVNDVVAHGIPSEKTILKDGDLISIDCGVFLDGFFADSAYTFSVGPIDEKLLKLMKTTRKSLSEGISFAKKGNRVGDISSAIQSYCETNGFSVVRELVGHGIGKNLHEDPDVPNYGKEGTGVLLREGLCLCIEPMVNVGKKRILFDRDGWSVRTADGMQSAHYEHCILITKGEPEVLSSFEYIDEVLRVNGN